MTYGATEILYVDGAAVNELTNPHIQIAANTFPTMIGARPLPDRGVFDSVFVGSIDEVAVYDLTLTASQIAAHFAAK